MVTVLLVILLAYYLFFEIRINQCDINIHEAAFLYPSPFPPVFDILGKLGYGGAEHSSIINSVNKKLIIATTDNRVLISVRTMLSVFHVLSFLVLILNSLTLVIIIPIL